MKEVSYSVEKCLKANVTKLGFDEVAVFFKELQELDKTACKETHYHKLDEWMDPVYKLVRARLESFGFVNASKEQPVDAAFWWNVYAVVSHVCYSVHMKTSVARHHASAWERSQALIADIQDIIEFKSSVTILA